jgi:hypothetical protein
MRDIRTWADIEAARAAGELTSAEEKLITCCQSGKKCILSKAPPETPNPEYKVGANLLRYLITGGDSGDPMHDIGVWLGGAYVAGPLDLDFARAKGATSLVHCFFENKISATNSNLKTLNLHASFLAKGLDAQGANIADNVNLTKTLIATGTVNFAGAKIGGQLACEEGCFPRYQGIALNLQNTQATDLFWRKMNEIGGRVDLSGAHFDTLTDDPESWERVTDLSLNGLTYTHITNPGDTAKRLEWLGKGHEMNGEFSPQPYTQLAKVLRDMGHDHGARQVLLAK